MRKCSLRCYLTLKDSVFEVKTFFIANVIYSSYDSLATFACILCFSSKLVLAI